VTATSATGTRRLQAHGVEHVTALLESDFGRLSRGSWAVGNHYLLDALDRGEHDRFVLWPGDDPVAVVYAGPTGTVVPAGDPAAGSALAQAAEDAGWRILIGDAPIFRAILAGAGRALFRRKPSAREQRFMVAGPAAAQTGRLECLRRARRDDLDQLTDFACRLHVEDRMGPPISRTGRAAVRTRMQDSVDRGATWVVERDGAPVGKVDLSLRSRRRGAQIAGVFVASEWRGRGLASGAVTTLTADLLADGFPVVTLHVRSDNAPAIAAYTRAGYTDQGAWLLALR
jgi:ribosomal protein S18 acetylase RimI-like enzyme